MLSWAKRENLFTRGTAQVLDIRKQSLHLCCVDFLSVCPAIYLIHTLPRIREWEQNLKLSCFFLNFRALAASAPIWQFPGMVPCGAFYKTVTQDFAKSGYNCDANIRKSWKAINNVSSTGKLNILELIYLICHITGNGIYLNYSEQSINHVKYYLWGRLVVCATFCPYGPHFWVVQSSIKAWNQTAVT